MKNRTKTVVSPVWTLSGAVCAACGDAVKPSASVYARNRRIDFCPSCAVDIRSGLELLYRGNPYDWPPTFEVLRASS
jgi:hypothetical protein